VGVTVPPARALIEKARAGGTARPPFTGEFVVEIPLVAPAREYGCEVYDPNLRPVEPKETVTVDCARPLWWTEFVKERIADAESRDALPEPVRDARVRVRIPEGPTLAAARGRGRRHGTRDGQTPWWEWEAWPRLMANTIRWAATGKVD
jgi:hypothetical protein